MSEFRIRHKKSKKFVRKLYNDFKLDDTGDSWKSKSTAGAALARIISKHDDVSTFNANDFELVEFQIKVTEVKSFPISDEILNAEWAKVVRAQDYFFSSSFRRLIRTGKVNDFKYLVHIGRKKEENTFFFSLNTTVDVDNWNKEVWQPIQALKLGKTAIMSESPVLIIADDKTLFTVKLLLGELFLKVLDYQAIKP